MIDDHPYRRPPFGPVNPRTMDFGRLNVVAGEIRQGLVEGTFANEPRAKLAHLATTVERSAAALSQQVASEMAMVTALAAVVTVLGGVATRLLTGVWLWLTVCAVGLALFFLGAVVARYRRIEAICARAAKAGDELQRFVMTLPVEGAATVRVRVDDLVESADAVASSESIVRRKGTA